MLLKLYAFVFDAFEGLFNMRLWKKLERDMNSKVINLKKRSILSEIPYPALRCVYVLPLAIRGSYQTP